jgi:hypothetical protein
MSQLESQPVGSSEPEDSDNHYEGRPSDESEEEAAKAFEEKQRIQKNMEENLFVNNWVPPNSKAAPANKKGFVGPRAEILFKPIEKHRVCRRQRSRFYSCEWGFAIRLVILIVAGWTSL